MGGRFILELSNYTIDNITNVNISTTTAASVATTTTTLFTTNASTNTIDAPTHPSHSAVSTQERALVAVLLSAICVAAVVGNVSLWIIVLTTRSLRNESNLLILCLSLADLLVSAISMPVTVVTVIASEWTFSSTMCVLMGYINMLAFVSSVESLGAISINRYIKICHPSLFVDVYTTRNVLLMWLGVWLISGVLSLPPLFGWARYGYLPLASICFCDWSVSASYAIFMIAACFCVPCTVMTVCYVSILRAFKQSRKTLDSFTEARKFDGSPSPGTSKSRSLQEYASNCERFDCAGGNCDIFNGSGLDERLCEKVYGSRGKCGRLHDSYESSDVSNGSESEENVREMLHGTGRSNKKPFYPCENFEIADSSDGDFGRLHDPCENPETVNGSAYEERCCKKVLCCSCENFEVADSSDGDFGIIKSPEIINELVYDTHEHFEGANDCCKNFKTVNGSGENLQKIYCSCENIEIVNGYGGNCSRKSCYGYNMDRAYGEVESDVHTNKCKNTLRETCFPQRRYRIFKPYHITRGRNKNVLKRIMHRKLSICTIYEDTVLDLFQRRKSQSNLDICYFSENIHKRSVLNEDIMPNNAFKDKRKSCLLIKSLDNLHMPISSVKTLNDTHIQRTLNSTDQSSTFKTNQFNSRSRRFSSKWLRTFFRSNSDSTHSKQPEILNDDIRLRQNEYIPGYIHASPGSVSSKVTQCIRINQRLFEHSLQRNPKESGTGGITQAQQHIPTSNNESVVLFNKNVPQDATSNHFISSTPPSSSSPSCLPFTPTSTNSQHQRHKQTAHERQQSAHVHQETSPKHKMTQSERRKREEFRLSASLLVVIVLFIFCWFPYCISMFVSIYTPSWSSRALDTGSLLLGYLNSCVNPIVYGLMNRRFKDGYQRLFAKYAPRCFTSCKQYDVNVTERRTEGLCVFYLRCCFVCWNRVEKHNVVAAIEVSD